MAFWINIYGCQPYPRHGSLKVNQLKNHSFRQALQWFQIGHRKLNICIWVPSIYVNPPKDHLLTNQRVLYVYLVFFQCNLIKGFFSLENAIIYYVHVVQIQLSKNSTSFFPSIGNYFYFKNQGNYSVFETMCT